MSLYRNFSITLGKQLRTERVRCGSAVCSAAENASKIADERINPDRFLWKLCPIMDVQLTSALRFTKIGPVGRFVAGASETGRFYEGLQQNGAVGISLFPVIGNLSAGHRHQVRGKVTRAYPR